jgi:hypothetical protein
MIVVNEQIQAENPDIFGSNGAQSRVFSLLEVAFNTGLMIGPLLSGTTVQAMGFYYANCVLGKCEHFSHLDEALHGN